jgi:hypothetical protein
MWAIADYKFAFGVATGEFWFRAGRRPNGGALILARTTQVTAEIYGVTLLALYALANPGGPRCLESAWDQVRSDLRDTLPWVGAIFAVVYAALYTRFAAQWSYLASLYNQIKEAELGLKPRSRSARNDRVLCEWKAAFIEDCQTLHLAAKPCFASIILGWSHHECVRAAYARHTAGGIYRLEKLLLIASDVHEREHAKWCPRERNTER